MSIPLGIAERSRTEIKPIAALGGDILLDAWLEIFNGGIENGLWPAHTAGFWAWRDRPNVLTLRFKELKRDLRGNVARIADFLGVALTEDQLDRVAGRSSFGWMKENEDRFGPPLMPFVPRNERPLMLRKGASGGSGELLTPAQQAAIDRYCISELRRLGSDFPYGEFFSLVD